MPTKKDQEAPKLQAQVEKLTAELVSMKVALDRYKDIDPGQLDEMLTTWPVLKGMIEQLYERGRPRMKT